MSNLGADQRPASRFVVGADLGQAADYTAIAIVEQPLGGDPRQRVQHLRHLERLPLGTSYVLVVEHIRRLLGRRELAGAELVVDRTGCGRPVVDLMRAEGLRPIAVTITSGSAARQEGRDHWLPKADLIGGLQVLVQSRRLLIAEALPLTRDLVRELTAFTTTIRLAGEAGEAPLWREQAHDDLVLAVALGAWWAGRGLGGAAAF